MRTCPDCAEEVKEAARVCRFCGFRFITPDERPDFTSYRMANGWSEADAGARPETRAEVEQFHYNRELYEKGDIHFVAVTAWRWGFQLLPPMIAL